jgi:hypothetical protein
MPANKFSRFMSRLNDRISISPRLVFLLSLYALFLASLVMTFVYAPFIGLAIIVLLAILVAQRARIRRGFAALFKHLRRVPASDQQPED